jgi:N-methylhydantoinase A
MPIGVDVGGTFTDVVHLDERTGALRIHKLLSTTTADSTIRGVKEVLPPGPAASTPPGFVGHGSTIATNAVIERRGARVALLTTRGFRDVLELGRLSRPPGHLYDLFLDLPEPLVRRAVRFEVTERVDCAGRVITPLDTAEVQAIARSLRQKGVTSVALCYLFAFLNPEHERRTRAILAEELPGVEVTLSSDVLPEFREYERTSTTVLHAYLKPLISGYLGTLGERLGGEAGVRCPLLVMQSNGGLSSPSVTIDRPATLLMSGPSGGVVASCSLAEQLGVADVITVDMGGTSFDVALVCGGRTEITEERRVLEQPLRVPMVDVHSIGAGGGSIAWLDEAGGLHVGPRSAGSSPGPACYGRGGTQPTVTDANVVLGYLDARSFLGGTMRIEPALAGEACGRIADAMSLGLLEVASGIRRLVNVAMAGAIRAMTVKKGRDPRNFALLAYGGAGPLHAADLMLELEIPVVLVPEYPGCFSAQGIIIADVRHDYVQSVVADFRQVGPDRLTSTFEMLATRGQRELERDGIPPERRVIEFGVDLRYTGQAYAIGIPVAELPVTRTFVEPGIARFHERHEEQYGFRDPAASVEVVNARVLAIGRMPRVAPAGPDRIQRGAAPESRTRRVHFAGIGDLEAAVHARTALEPGQSLEGPVIIEQLDTTTVVPPDLRVTVHPSRTLIIERGR